MFTKKPLGGNSCASCERNITNLSMMQADYTPWKKLPFRDPSDRIAKVFKFNIYIRYSMGKDFQKCFKC